MNNVKTVKRTLVTTVALLISFTAASAQGKLVETAMKLFSPGKTEKVENEIQLINASYIEEMEAESTLRIRDLFPGLRQSSAASSDVLESFTVQNLRVGYEDALATEAWMTEDLSDNFEPALVTEEWMTEDLDESFEPALATEQWMTEDLSDNFEPALVTEEWMTENLGKSSEPALATEQWMAEPLYKSSNLSGGESELNVEPWMLSVFNEENTQEEALAVEDWMSEPFETSNNENELVAEGWMMKPIF